MNAILQSTDPPNTEEDLYTQKRDMTTTIDKRKDEEGDATLGSLVDTFFDPDIRFNMLKFKHRCVYYMRKLYYIYETNFHHHFKIHQQQLAEAQNQLKLMGLNDQMSVDTSKFSRMDTTKENENRSLM